MSDVPVWLTAGLIVVVSALVAIGALALFQKLVKFEITDGHNEIAGLVFTTVGVLYSVVLAFVVFAVWSRFSTVDQGVADEAALIVSTYRDTQTFPEPERADAQESLRTYVHVVMDNEWAAHGELTAHKKPDALNAPWRAFRRAAASPGVNAAEMDRAQNHLHEVEVARHDRHLSREKSLPGIFWFILLTGSIFTLAFAFMFNMGNALLQRVVTSLLAGLMAALLFLIFSLERPFTGPVHVSKQPMQHALVQFDAIDKTD